MDTGRKKQLEKFIDVLGLSSFHNLLILDQALTHSSYANENKAKHGYYNERLEFLGDAILDLVVGEYLFLQYPHMPEGELSKARASVVSEAPLAAVCATFDMGDYILLGKGELASRSRQGSRRRLRQDQKGCGTACRSRSSETITCNIERMRLSPSFFCLR